MAKFDICIERVIYEHYLIDRDDIAQASEKALDLKTCKGQDWALDRKSEEIIKIRSISEL